MKKIKLLGLFMILSAGIIAQTGSVYNFFFKVDPQLTDYFQWEDKSRKLFSGYSESETMPQLLMDSIKKKTETFFTTLLGMPVKLCFRKNKKGEDVGSIGISGLLEGLPDNTFNKGKDLCPASTRFIALDVQIYPSGGTQIKLVNQYTKLKPKLQIALKVYDENKTEVVKKEIVLKDFEKLRSITRYYRTVEVTNAETLTPYDIYAMYLMGLETLLKK